MPAQLSEPRPFLQPALQALWLVVLSSIPFLLIVVIQQFQPRWFDWALLLPQILWAASLLLLRHLHLQRWWAQLGAAVLAVGLGYVAFLFGRQIHIDTYDIRDWGGALDVFIVAFIYLPVVFITFLVTWAARRPLRLGPLFEP